MFDLVRLAAMLALPILVIGALMWLLLYTAVRLGIRHEVSRLQAQRAARPTRAATRSRPARTSAGAAPFVEQGRAAS
jgi:hypothetical protein